ncbi:MAG: HAD family hydrolase [Candidatus Dojkabacteria bacterium]
MNYSNIKYILFDAGNVLVYKRTHEDENVAKLINLTRPEYRALLDRLIEEQTDEEKQQFKDINTVEKEYIYLQVLHKKICIELNIDPDPELIEKMTQCRMRGDFALKDGIIETLTTLSSKYSLGILSNALPSRRAHELKIQNLESFFSHIFISHEIGLEKPDPEIYEYALKKINIPVNQILFVDDKLEYLEGAERVGFKNLVMFKNKDLSDQYPLIEDIKELVSMLLV